MMVNDEPTRVEVLTALMADRALTASELVEITGVNKATISAHLAQLVEARLIVVAAQGPHRYFHLADCDVAASLESMLGVAFRAGAVPLRSGPREPALRKARVCYGHLAGELGVFAYEALMQRRILHERGDSITVSAAGNVWFKEFGVEVESLTANRRILCRACLDWSERRRHLAGGLGRAFLQRVEELGWAHRGGKTRVVAFTPSGEGSFRALLSTNSSSASSRKRRRLDDFPAVRSHPGRIPKAAGAAEIVG